MSGRSANAPLTNLESEVCDTIANRVDELVELTRILIGFDTRTPTVEIPWRREAELQGYLAERLSACGAAVELGEPDVRLIGEHPMIPPGFSFAGRPQLVARFAGSGDGRTLLFNGHIDTVDIEPADKWPFDPFAGTIADAAIHGRGACDMKGGVACMVFAAETLASLGIKLSGELIVNTVTEEESTGAGGLVTARTVRADGAIVPEPSSMNVWIACRGSLLERITITGRAGHAGVRPRHPDDGGAVNAIEKMMVILDAIRRLREEWSLRDRHPYLSPADCVPTIVRGGEWLVSYPEGCVLDCHIEYLPGDADEHGYGSRVEAQFREWINRAAQADPWLAANPPLIESVEGAVPPAEVSPDDGLVTATLGASRSVRPDAMLAGLDNWHDGATLTVEAGIPAVCLGPGSIHHAHTLSEHVPIADLVACAQALAVAAIRYTEAP